MILVPARIAVGKRKWTLLHSEDYEHGGSEGSTYSSGPATGWTHGADYGHATRIWTGQTGGRALRFPTQAESGGSGNSMYRTQCIFTAGYFSTNNCTTEFRLDAEVKIPTSGGYTRQDGGGAGAIYAALATFGNGTRQHCFGIKTASTLGIWVNSTAGDAGCPASGTNPTVSGTYSGSTAGSWYPVSYRLKMHATLGYLEFWWNGAKVASFAGDTRFSSGSNTGIIGVSYVLSTCGGTSSVSDKNYFGGIDNVKTYKA